MDLYPYSSILYAFLYTFYLFQNTLIFFYSERIIDYSSLSKLQSDANTLNAHPYLQRQQH